MIESGTWEAYKQYLIIAPGFGIGLLVWFLIGIIAGLPFWSGSFLAVFITIVYEILACKYELHFSNVRKIVMVTFIVGLLVFGVTFILGSGELIKEFHVSISFKNNYNGTVFVTIQELKGDNPSFFGTYVSPGGSDDIGTYRFSTWCLPEGSFK